MYKRLFFFKLSFFLAILENNKSQIFGSYKRKLLSDSLVNVRQHEICLKTILNDIIICAKNVEHLQVQLGQRLDHLKNTIQSKNAIPTAQVYVFNFILLFNCVRKKIRNQDKKNFNFKHFDLISFIVRNKIKSKYEDIFKIIF